MATAEYICAQCWHSFEGEDSGNNALKCPECGAEQPRGDSSAAQETAAPPAAPSPEEPVSPAVPDAVLVQAESKSAEGEGHSGGTDEESATDPLAGIDPNRCGWRVRSGGLTYNFHGLEALENWCSSKKTLDNMEVSIESTGVWLNLQEYRQSLRKEEPLAAYRRLGGMDAEEEEETLISFPDDVSAATKPPMEPKPVVDGNKTTPEKPRAPEPSMAPRPSKPSIRSTGEFTFKVGEAPRGESPTWAVFAGGFVVGLVFGLALWYLGLLSALDIEPIALF